MGSRQHRHPSVQIVAKRHFLAGGFRMKIGQDNLRLLGKPPNLPIGCQKRTIQSVHEDPPFQIQHPDLDAGNTRENTGATTRSRVRIVGGTQDTPFLFQKRHHFLLAPDMVAACQHIDARVKQFDGHGRSQPHAGSGIFAIRHHEIDPVALHNLPQSTAQGKAAGPANNIPDEQNRKRSGTHRA